MFEDCSDNEDEWFFDSVRRYKLLNMFEIQGIPQHLALTDSQRICVASNNDKGKLELAEYQTSTRVLSDAGLSKSDDLKLNCGGFTEGDISQMKVQFGKGKLYTSESHGISLYNLQSNSGTIERVKFIYCQLAKARMALRCQDNPQILLSKCTKFESYLLDLERLDHGNIVILEGMTSSEPPDMTMPLFVDFNLTAICNIRSGNVNFYDLRTNKRNLQIKESLSGCGDSWTFESTYNSQVHFGSCTDWCTRLSLLSNNGCFINFDIRDLEKPLLKQNLDLKIDNKKNSIKHIQLSYNPCNENILSVSGFDSNVYLYKVGDAVEQLFVHDGHSHVENCDKITVTTGHTWLNSGDGIVSCALNKTLHIWKFNIV